MCGWGGYIHVKVFFNVVMTFSSNLSCFFLMLKWLFLLTLVVFFNVEMAFPSNLNCAYVGRVVDSEKRNGKNKFFGV